MCSVMALSLSEYKIRYPDFPKYIWDSPHPYSDVMNMKKDRRNPEHTKRPLNAFMLFAKIQREHITTHFNCNHSEISKALGRLWQDLSREEKEPFTQGAKTLVALHRLEYPDYKYRPRKKGQPKEGAVAAAATTPVKKSAPRRAASRTGARAAERNASTRTLDRPSDGACEWTSDPTSDLAPSGGSDRAVSSAGSPAPPESPLSFCLASPSRLHTPCSPVSIGSSSGYESELPYELGGRVADEYELGPAQDDPLHGFGAEPEPEIGADLRDIEVTALDETAMLNPLAMFPALGLTCDDLDELRLHL